MKTSSELVPLLVVRGAARAIDFYVEALGAKVLARYEHGAERYLSHADLALADCRFAVTEEAPAWNSVAPRSLIVRHTRCTASDARTQGNSSPSRISSPFDNVHVAGLAIRSTV